MEKSIFIFMFFEKRRKIFLAFPSIFKPINPILVPPLHVLSSLSGWKKNLLINFRMKKSENKLSCWKFYRLKHFILLICRENVRKILNVEVICGLKTASMDILKINYWRKLILTLERVQ